MKSISILIPNYNGAELLKENLPYAFRALDKLDCRYEILVADDCSKDDSCQILELHFPQVRLIKGDKNLGFAGNCNRGFAACEGETVLILNSDVKLSPEYLSILLPFMEDDSVFGVSGSIMPDGPGEIMDAGKFPVWKGSMLNTTTNFLPFENGQTAFPSLFLSGAASLVNASKFRQMGGFLELLNPYYFEDAEVCFHAWRRGWRSLYVPQAKCYHRISSTIGKTASPVSVAAVARRNKLLLHEIHLDGWRKIWWRFLLLFQFPLMYLFPNSKNAMAFRQFLDRRQQAIERRHQLESFPGMLGLSEIVEKIQAELKGKILRYF